MAYSALRGNRGPYLALKRLEGIVIVPLQRRAPTQSEFGLIGSSSMELGYLAEAFRSSRGLQQGQECLPPHPSQCPALANLGIESLRSAALLAFRGGYQPRSIAPSSYCKWQSRLFWLELQSLFCYWAVESYGLDA
jgi:hypothetical protein